MERGPVMTLDVHGQKRALPYASTNDFVSLPEDVQLEIISHISNIEDLFRFAVTCRGWMHRFTDRAFLRALSAKTNRGRLIGFFFQTTRLTFRATWLTRRWAAERESSVSPPTFLSSPWSLLGGPAERPLTAFVPDKNGTFNYAEPLEARHGIVLMQLVPRRRRRFDGGGGGGDEQLPVRLSLCNPITGECRFLPPLELETTEAPDDWEFGGHVGAVRPDPEVTMTAAVITPAANLDGGGGQRLQHLLIGTKGSSEQEPVYLHSYSAGTRSWSAPTRLLELEASHHSTVLDRAAVVHGGAAHWLCTDGRKHRGDEDLYKLSVELVGTTRASMTKLPFHFRTRGSPLLCVNKDGRLSAICIYVMHVTIWTQQECRKEGNGNGTPAGADARWHRTAAIRIAPDPNYQPEYNDVCRWSGSRDGTLLVLTKLDVLRRSTRIFMVDLEKKKQMEVVKDISLPYEYRRNNLTVVPYEMDLEKFFTLRLHHAAGTKPAS